MPDRRELRFVEVVEVIPEVDRLLAGHVTVGRWSLREILDHLATAFELTLQTGATATEPTREQAVARRLFFRRGRFPEGIEAPPELVRPASQLDLDAEAARFRALVGRFASAVGPFPAHPRLGPLTRDEWHRFHCMHAAHHLSFALPR